MLFKVFDVLTIYFDQAILNEISIMIMQYKTQKIYEEDFTYIFSRCFDAFNSAERVVAMILFSFDLRFDIEDLNVHFTLFDKKSLEEIFSHEISKIKSTEI